MAIAVYMRVKSYKQKKYQIYELYNFMPSLLAKKYIYFSSLSTKGKKHTQKITFSNRQ